MTTKRTKRTDIHRPGAIVPADYVGVLDYALASSSDGVRVPALGVNCELERAVVAADGTRTLGEHHPSGRCCVLGLRTIAKVPFVATGGCGKCSICGATYTYGSVWRHEPTGEHLHVGHDCADKYEMLMDHSAFELEHGRLKRASAIQLIRERNAADRAEFLAAHPGLPEAFALVAEGKAHPILRDLAAQFQTLPYLSDKQVALALKLAREALAPAEEAERYVAAPTGTVEFEGVVVSAKGYDSVYGVTTKITVRVETPAGSWLAWGTVPASIHSAVGHENRRLRGARVRIKAALKAGRDAHFALMGRPRGELLQENAAEQAA